MRYEIQTFTVCDGWVNTWTIIDDEGNESPEIFDHYQDAKDSLVEFLEEEDQSYFNGYIESRYTADEFRIVEVGHGSD